MAGTSKLKWFAHSFSTSGLVVMSCVDGIYLKVGGVGERERGQKINFIQMVNNNRINNNKNYSSRSGCFKTNYKCMFRAMKRIDASVYGKV